MDDNPWLRIPVEDYEGHMQAAGQSTALRAFFSRIYAQRSPGRVAILGCSTGGDLQQVDTAVTELAIGVDLNPSYLAVARQRLNAFRPRIQLIQGDVLEVELPPPPFDLIHAALLIEYVAPAPLFARISRWLSPEGTFSLVTQEPRDAVPAVSKTGFASLQALSGRMVLRNAAAVTTLANEAGFRLASTHAVELPGGKTLVHSCFER